MIKNLSTIFSLVLQQHNKSTQILWQYRIQKLLVLCIKQVFGSPMPIAIPMRIVEIFTSFESIRRQAPTGTDDQDVVHFLKCLFSYVIDQNYFRNVRKMLNEKIPENTYDEVTIRPVNEISRVLLEMIERPLKLVNTFSSDPTFDHKILSSFVSEILTKDFNRTISNYIVPSLGSQSEFPFIKLLRFLHDIHMDTLRHCEVFSSVIPMDNNNYDMVLKSHKNIRFNGNLLYSLLKLDEKFLDDVISQNCLSHYLIVIGAMIGNISKLPKPDPYVSHTIFDDDEAALENSDSDDDTDDDDQEMQPQNERLTLGETINLLNEQNRVSKIVKDVEGVLYKPEVVHSLCQIAHNLMIYNKAAMSKYR